MVSFFQNTPYGNKAESKYTSLVFGGFTDGSVSDLHACTHARMLKRTNRQMGGRAQADRDAWTDERTDGRTD